MHLRLAAISIELQNVTYDSRLTEQEENADCCAIHGIIASYIVP